MPALFRRVSAEPSTYVDQSVAMLGAMASPRVPFDEASARRVLERSADRGIHPQGTRRQLSAILTQPDRTEALRQLTIPTLVIHGTADPVMGISGGRATAAAIPGAQMLEIDGMGHDLPRFAWPQIVKNITAVANRGEREHPVSTPTRLKRLETLWPSVGHRHNNEE